jgi:hypothetical protein
MSGMCRAAGILAQEHRDKSGNIPSTDNPKARESVSGREWRGGSEMSVGRTVSTDIHHTPWFLPGGGRTAGYLQDHLGLGV